MAVNKKCVVRVLRMHGEGVSQVTEVTLTGGQLKETRIERRGGDVVLVVHGAGEVAALVEAFKAVNADSLNAPVAVENDLTQDKVEEEVETETPEDASDY